jgi:hypothetical protein
LGDEDILGSELSIYEMKTNTNFEYKTEFTQTTTIPNHFDTLHVINCKVLCKTVNDRKDWINDQDYLPQRITVIRTEQKPSFENFIFEFSIGNKKYDNCYTVAKYPDGSIKFGKPISL